jgi:Rab-GTPase-TBC domain-containing protein
MSRTPSQIQSGLVSPDRTPTAASMAANVAGRFKSPFSWLSRNQTSNDKKTSTVMSPTFDRASDADIRLANSDDDQAVSNHRNSQASLRDRFKAVRMREEAGVSILPPVPVGEEHAPQSPLDSPPPTEKTPGDASPASVRRTSSSSVPQTVNPNLAPGTASGIAEGPRNWQDPVDWDLWQALVTEGPMAVARSSSEELNLAIAAGIPQAIRGVIWQVLADSKNEQMEKFYHELVARGTDKERLLNGHGDSNGTKERESVVSSASSVHSENSNQVANGSPIQSPSASVDGFTNPMAPKPKGPKEEIAHIQVLEKTIRRDLGARTSYSKYLMSSGLQDGLFGICKAYALYDEEVGYAQGMNFIAMPLLFNVSFTITRSVSPLTINRCEKKKLSACSLK